MLVKPGHLSWYKVMEAKPGTPAEGFTAPSEQLLPLLQNGFPIYISQRCCLLQCVIADLCSAYDLLEDAFLFHIISSPVTPHTLFLRRIIIFFRSLYLSLLDCILFFWPLLQLNNLLILIQSSSVTADFPSLISSGIFINMYFIHLTRKINHLPCPLVSHWLLFWECSLFAKPILRNFLSFSCIRAI